MAKGEAYYSGMMLDESEPLLPHSHEKSKYVKPANYEYWRLTR